MGVILDGFPAWSQRLDVDPSLGADPFADSDCGEECCSIVQFAYGMGYTTETQVRDAMPGHSGHGETTPNDLAQYLLKIGLNAHVQPINRKRLQQALRHEVDHGNCVILLGNFVDPSILHWVVAIGYGNDHIVYNDPWSGAMLTMRWDRFRSLYNGLAVLVSRP